MFLSLKNSWAIRFWRLFAISARIKINATKAYTEINLSLEKVVTGRTDLDFLILNSHWFRYIQSI